MVKNYAVEKVRCEIWQEHQKMRLFLISSLIMQDEQKGCILWGSKCCSCWVLNLYLIIINVFREKGCDFWLISGWFVQYLPSLLAVWLVCWWFVGDSTGLWVIWLVCGWFWILQLAIIGENFSSGVRCIF